MKRMWSRNELKNISGAQAQEEIQDIFPSPESTDSGKVLGVNAEGKYELKEPGAVASVDLANIEDANGNKRFIEGSIEVASQTGFTQDYGRWSLSGTHLLIVVAGTVDAGAEAEISLNTSIELPSWVMAKIFPLGNTNNVAYGEIRIVDNSTSERTSQDVILIRAYDSGAGKWILQFYHSSKIGGTNSNSFRVQFDLLIDNA